MRNLRRVGWIVGLSVALIAGGTTPVDAGAARTRSGGAAERGKEAARATSRASSGRAARGPARTATGSATYGHRYRLSGRHHYPRHGYRYYGFGYYPYGHYSPYYYPWSPVYYGFGAWPWYYTGHAGTYSSAGVQADRSQAPAVVETVVRPKRASVLLDGEPVGEARDYNGSWDRLFVDPGVHEIQFEAEGYRTLRLHLTTRPGGLYVIRERLKKGEGLDPRSTEAPPAEPEPTPERAARAGAGVLAVEPGSSERSPGSLRSGLLRIRVQPADAAVYLDGDFLARADELARLHGAIPVARGVHRVEVVRPGYASRSVEVNVEGPEPNEVSLRLERLP